MKIKKSKTSPPLFSTCSTLHSFLLTVTVSQIANAKKKITPTPSPAGAPPTVWTEPWTDTNYLSRWDVVTDNCYSVNSGFMEMTCESGGITSKQRWSRDNEIIVEGEVSAENAVPDANGEKKYWGGLTLFNEHKNEKGWDDSRYGELAVQSQVPPTSWYKDSIVTLTNELGGMFKVIQPATPGSIYKFKIHYKKDGKPSKKRSGFKYFYYVNDKLVQSIDASMLENPNIFILCVATGAGGVTSARAHCEFGPIKVTGEMVQ